MRLLDFYFFQKRVKQSRFAEALALADFSVSGNLILWSFYRLGMYKTVVESEGDFKNILDIQAKIISLASLGYKQEVVQLLPSLKHKKEVSAQVALALAGYMPEQALKLLGNIDENNAALYLALLWELNEIEQSKLVAHEIINNLPAVLDKTNEQIALVFSNILAESAQNKLDFLNKFLLNFSLASISLIDQSKKLNVHNVVCAPINSRLDQTELPLVSVLVTTYNASQTIEMNLLSLLKQTHTNIEIIVIDDASTDDTVEKIKKLMLDNKKIKFVQLPLNVGTYVAKSIGFQYAKGEFVTCHDSDDWAHPERIEYQVKPLLKNKNLVATTCNWVRVDDDGHFYVRQIYPLNRLDPASPLFRRKFVLEKMGIWNLVRTGADSEFLARLKLVFGRKAIHAIKAPLVLGYHRKGSLMTSSVTGHLSNQVAPIRQDYWESWNNWHICQLKLQHAIYMPSWTDNMYPFDVPDAIRIPFENVKQAFEHHSCCF